MIYIGNNESLMKKILVVMTNSTLGQVHYFLGMQAQQQLEGIFISQAKYAAALLEKFWNEGMQGSGNPISGWREINQGGYKS